MADNKAAQIGIAMAIAAAHDVELYTRLDVLGIQFNDELTTAEKEALSAADWYLDDDASDENAWMTFV
jgi:hypothetical protein